MEPSLGTIRGLLAREEPVRWIFAGDSITHGAKHTMGWRDYPELFSERVRSELARPRDRVITTAISGWAIWDIEADLEWNILVENPDVVSINLGPNDCLRPKPLEEFKATYLDVLDRVRERTGAALIVHTANQVIETAGPELVAGLADYAQAAREVAEESGAVLVDHFEHWDNQVEGVIHEWIGHGCHPNQYGHRAMAHLLFREIGIWDDESRTCQLFVPRKWES